MADTKTADQWKQVAAQLDAQIGGLEKQQTQLQDQILTLKQQQVQLNGKIGSLPIGPERTAANQQYGELTRQINGLENQNGQLSQQIQRLDIELQAAERQAETAQDSPPGSRANPVTMSTPPPVNAEPGNNTDVPPANDTQFALANAEPATINLNDNAFISDEEADLLELQREEANAILPPETPTVISDEEADLLEAQRDEGAAIAGGFDRPEVISDEEADLLQIQREEGDAIGAGIARGGTGTSPGPGVGSGTAPVSTPNITTGTTNARNSGPLAGLTPFPNSPDWRVRISLAPSATYLYAAATETDILYPLKATRGVIFPYTPQISVGYNANYEGTDLTHSNYKIYNYKNSSVENISITGDFTAQDTSEANYMLAVIHFFRSVTKMFYGKDENPIRGVPPPLVYLSGHGQYGFDNHPMVITQFTLNYPNDVDYINAGLSVGSPPSLTPYKPPSMNLSPSVNRLYASKLNTGGVAPPPQFTGSSSSAVTRVPTRLQIQISAYPIVTRYDISNNFSLKDYATGKLLRGSARPNGGGIW